MLARVRVLTFVPAFVLSALGSTACGGDATTPESVATVVVSPLTATLVVGHSRQFDVSLRGTAGTALAHRSVTWSSSAPEIAAVTKSGFVSGISAGSAFISVVSGGRAGSSLVTVLPPVASVTASPEALRVEPGTSRQLTAIAKDANGGTLPGRTVTWSTTNPSVASVEPFTGNMVAIAEGSASITATSEGKSATVTVVVTVEPLGMSVVSDVAFDCLQAACAPGWAYQEYGNGSVGSIIQDATAPKSPPNVAQVAFPPGFTSIDGPATIYRTIGTYQTLYISTWIKLSSNWIGNPTGNNKMLYLWMDGQIMLITEAVGAGTAPLHPTNYLLYLGATYPWYPNPFGIAYSSQFPTLEANVANAEIVRGQWHHYEYVINVGTPGVANGTFEAWLDGKKTHNFTDIMWRLAGAAANFSYLQWSPIWGGNAGTIFVEQRQFMDHIYISGK